MWQLAGTLNRPDSVTPEFHMFIEEQLSWTKLDDGLPRNSTFAPTRSGKEEDE